MLPVDFLRLLSLTLWLLVAQMAIGQLDTWHWIPPMHSRDNGQINDHYLYLSTPSQEPVEVTITEPATPNQNAPSQRISHLPATLQPE